MPRERDGYRDCYADLLEFFGQKRLIKPGDAARYFGVCPRTAAKRYDIPADGIALPILARRMCQ